MKEFEEKDIKQCGVDILQQVHLFCEKNRLRYILFYGSLLGAVRHHGYIPWDDDIDILMPRDDYNYFVKNFDLENYGVKSCHTDKNYYLPWAKAFDKRTIMIEPVPVSKDFEIGFNIDIFPADLLSKRENYWKIKKKELPLVRKLVYSQFKVDKIDTLKSLAKRFLQLFYAGKGNRYSKIVDTFFLEKDKANAEKTCYITNAVFIDVKKRAYIFPMSLFDKRILIPFEENCFYGPECFDEVLTICYGDYMTLPPKEKQVTHHSFRAFYKD